MIADKPSMAGDLVRLKSGGSVMTISHRFADGLFLCMWHGADGKPHCEQYREEMLEPIGPRGCDLRPGGWTKAESHLIATGIAF
jgi:uncharacterized protein YodC (DUF2158 family)